MSNASDCQHPIPVPYAYGAGWKPLTSPCGEGREYCIPCEDCRTPVCDQHRVSVVFEDGSQDLCFACAKRAMDVEDGADALKRKVA